jgi:hypothetical protein
MNITEIPPTGRTFCIELNENELKLLGIIIGETGEYQFKDMVELGRYYDGTTYEPRFTHKLYDLINHTLRS